MTHRGWAWAVGSFIWGVTLPPADAYFQAWGGGARGRGMAEAVTAQPGLLEALSYNPAGLGALSAPEWMGSYGAWGLGMGDGSALRDQMLAGFLPLSGWGGVGGGWTRRGLEGSLTEDVWLLNWSQAFPSSNPSPGTLAAFGLTVKWWRLEQTPNYYVDNNPAILRSSSSTWSVDAGLHLYVGPGVLLGIALQDPFRPVISLVADGAQLPTTYRAGLSIQWDPQWMTTTDVVVRDAAVTWGTGLEWRLESYAVRSGVAAASAYGRPFALQEWTAGGQIGWVTPAGRLSVDYAFRALLSGWPDPWGSHRLSVSLQLPDRFEESMVRTNEITAANLFPPLWKIHGHLAFDESSFSDLNRLEQEQPGDAALLHRSALLAAVTGLTLEAQARYHRLGESREWSVLAYSALGELRYPKPGQSLLIHYRSALQSPSGPTDRWWGAGLLAAREGHYEEALLDWKRWVDQEVRSGGTATATSASYNLGLAALQAGNLEEASTHLQPLLTSMGDDGMVYEAWGRLELARRRPDLALTSFRRASELSGHHPRARYHIGLALFALARYDEAVSQVEAVVKEYSDHRDAPVIHSGLTALRRESLAQLLQLVKAAETTGQWPVALDVYRKISTIDPSFPEIATRLQATAERMSRYVQERRALAEREEDNGRFREAAMAWREILSVEPGNEDVIKQIKRLMGPQLIEAQAHRQAGRVREAFQIYDFVDQVDPGNEGSASGRAAVRVGFSSQAEDFLKQGRYGDAERAWKAWLEIKPDDGEALRAMHSLKERRDQQVAQLLQEAQQAFAAKNLKGAAEKAHQAMTIHPDSAEARAVLTSMEKEITQAVKTAMDRGLKAESAGDYAAARLAFQEVGELDPAKAKEMQGRIAQLDKTRGGKLQQLLNGAIELNGRYDASGAMEKLSELLRMSPNHEEGKKLAAQIKGRLDAAKANHKAVEQLSLEGDIAFGNGQIAQAIRAWEKALDLDYYHTEIRKKLSDARKNQ